MISKCPVFDDLIMGVLAFSICVFFVLCNGLVDHEILAAKLIEPCQDHALETVQHPSINPAIILTTAKPILRAVTIPTATGKPILVPIKNTPNGYKLVLNPKNCSSTAEPVNCLQHVTITSGDKPEHDIIQTDCDENKTHINNNMIAVTTRPVLYRGKPLACALFYDDAKVHNLNNTIAQVHDIADKSNCEHKVEDTPPSEHNCVDNLHENHVTQPMHALECVTPKPVDIEPNITSICNINSTNDTDHNEEQIASIIQVDQKSKAESNNKTIIEHVSDCNGNMHEIEHQEPITQSPVKENEPKTTQTNTTECVTEHVVPEELKHPCTEAPVIKLVTQKPVTTTTKAPAEPTSCKSDIQIVENTSSKVSCVNRTENRVKIEGKNNTESKIELLGDGDQLIGTIDIDQNDTITIENQTVEEVEEFNKTPGKVYENMQLSWSGTDTARGTTKSPTKNTVANCNDYYFNNNLSPKNSYNQILNYNDDQNSNAINYGSNVNSNYYEYDSSNSNWCIDNNQNSKDYFNNNTPSPYIIVNPRLNSNAMNTICNNNNQKPRTNNPTTIEQTIPLQCSKNRLMLPGSYTVSTTGDKIKDKVHRLWKNTQIRICNRNKNAAPFKIVLNGKKDNNRKTNAKTTTVKPIIRYGCYSNQNSGQGQSYRSM